MKYFQGECQMPDSKYSPELNDEQAKMAKRIGNFSLAVTAALLATAGSSQAAVVRPATEAQAAISGLAGLTPSVRILAQYSNTYTNWSDYSNHSNYNNYYSNWADYVNVAK
jgi:hypothetical protein